MSKYLELFRDAFDDSINAKTKPENKPYIGYSIEEGKVVYTKIPNYLCLEPIDSNNQLALAKIGDYSNIQYSFDKSNWNDFTTDPTNPLNLTYISVDKPIYLRGNNPNGILNQELLVGCKLVSSGKYNVSGDVTTLLNEVGDVRDLTPYGEQTLASLFGSIPSSNSGLPIDLPCVDIVDASKLILPSITLSPECYLGMFSCCTSLTAAPELPATKLVDYCYGHMFSDCTSLTSAPELPATMLAEGCYYSMFDNCTALTTAPKILPATVLAEGCYNSMFDGCTSLTTAPELPATTLAERCYEYMFYNCTSLTTSPELPATELADSCYNSMFERCTSLTIAPELPATTLAGYCYYSMFESCTSLTSAPKILPATSLTDFCYSGMFMSCTSLTAAPKILPATVLAKNCYTSMFEGCTSLTTAPELPATVLAEHCYYGMFYGCSSLNYIKCLATNIPASNCTTNWVGGVPLTGTFVKHPDMNNWSTGVNSIPSGWTVVDAEL
jgi:hypothetical protein